MGKSCNCRTRAHGLRGERLWGANRRGVPIPCTNFLHGFAVSDSLRGPYPHRFSHWFLRGQVLVPELLAFARRRANPVVLILNRSSRRRENEWLSRSIVCCINFCIVKEQQEEEGLIIGCLTLCRTRCAALTHRMTELGTSSYNADAHYDSPAGESQYSTSERGARRCLGPLVWRLPSHCGCRMLLLVAICGYEVLCLAAAYFE